jgi:hypothetical protein
VFQTRGTDGTLKYGYHTVARLSEWTLDIDKGVYRLSGRAKEVNEHWAKEATEFGVVLMVGRQEMRWHDVPVSIAGEHIAATLPRHEKKGA